LISATSVVTGKKSFSRLSEIVKQCRFAQNSTAQIILITEMKLNKYVSLLSSTQLWGARVRDACSGEDWFREETTFAPVCVSRHRRIGSNASVSRSRNCE
jgi:hypothetical protein